MKTIITLTPEELKEIIINEFTEIVDVEFVMESVLSGYGKGEKSEMELTKIRLETSVNFLDKEKYIDRNTPR